MRVLAFLFLLVLTSTFSLVAQQTTVLLPETRKMRVDEILYNKQTGEKMTAEQLQLLLQENPGLRLEPIYNRFGETEKFLYDPVNPFFERKKDPNLRPKIGEKFPVLTLRTLNGESFSSEDLRGSWVILHFFPIIHAIQKPRWEKLRSDLQTARKSGVQIEGFGVFATDKDPASVVGEYQDVIHLVNSARGFYDMFHIIEIPTTILIDPDGTVVSYFYKDDKIEFLEFVDKKIEN